MTPALVLSWESVQVFLSTPFFFTLPISFSLSPPFSMGEAVLFLFLFFFFFQDKILRCLLDILIFFLSFFLSLVF